MDGVYLDENRELAADFDIMSWIMFPNKSFFKLKLGNLERQGSPDLKFSLDQDGFAKLKWLKKVGKMSLFHFRDSKAFEFCNDLFVL